MAPVRPAKYWTEVYFTSAKKANFSFSAFRVASSDMSSHHIAQIAFRSLVLLHEFRFTVVACVCDGASEHRTFQGKFSNISVGDVCALLSPLNVLDAERAAEEGYRPEIAYCSANFMIAFAHPTTGMPVFIMSDPPHLLKKGWASLHKSARPGNKK